MPIDLPTPAGIRRSTFGLETVSQSFQSPFTRNRQLVMLSPGLWTTTLTLRRCKKTEAYALHWISFFLRLDGMAGTFNAYDPDRRVPLGLLGGTPLVKGAGQSGNTLLIDGGTAGVFGWARTGDYFSCNGELKQLTQDANTNGSGEATLNFRPAWRTSPPDDAAVNFTNPTVTMSLLDDQAAIWEADEAGVYQEKTFSAMEVY